METMNDALVPNVIDSSPNRELISVLKDQIRKSKESKFAIGYFFLSGFSLVREDFPNSYDTLPFLKIVRGNETTYLTKEELVAGYNHRELFKQRMVEDLAPGAEKELEELETENTKTIEDVYVAIANDGEIQEQIEKIKGHERVKVIEGGDSQ